MNDLLERSLHGVAIYNPRLLSKEELIGFFVARQAELEQLVAALRRESKAQPQHHLVVGARGMGKTTLLNRLRYAIEDDEELASRCLGLVFPEEQYNVVCLADFWLNCVDALADELEPTGRLEGLDEEIERVQSLARKDERGRQALELLCALSDRLQRRLVLLVDNVDLVLDRLEDEQWALREVLSSEARIQLVGATSAPLESHYRHDKAFYDFFRVHHLEGLDDDETFTVLRRLAEATGHERVARLLDEEPGRVKTVRLMAGGNPRMVVLLFSVLAQGTDGDVRTDIERLLDQCTPFYKHRLEGLPMQAQQVLDALAKHWNPATAGVIAEATHLQVNVVSVQLDRLVKEGTVEKVALPDTKRQGFQVAERFFNIWCLMRSSRRVRRRLVWLVEFLRLMYGAEELAERARRHLADRSPVDALRNAEFGMALADLVQDAQLRTALETHSIRTLCNDSDLRRHLGELFDLDDQDKHLVGKTERLRLLAEAREAVMTAHVDIPGWDPERRWEIVGGAPWLTVQHKHSAADGIQSSPALAGAILSMYGYPWMRYQGLFQSEEHASLVLALREGDVAIENLVSGELDSARLALNAPSLIACALGMALHLGIPVDFAWFTLEVQHSNSLLPWLQWAETALDRGISTEEIWSKIAPIINSYNWTGFDVLLLGEFLDDHPETLREAQRIYYDLVDVYIHQLMLVHVRHALFKGDWTYASKLLRCSLTEPYVRFFDENWSSMLDLFADVVKFGFSAEARTLLVAIGIGKRWEPLDRALEVVELHDTTALERLAPEMREAVRLVLAKISPQTLKEPTPPTPKRRPTTKKS